MVNRRSYPLSFKNLNRRYLFVSEANGSICSKFGIESGLEALLVGIEIGNWVAGDTGGGCGLSDGWGDALHESWVEWRWDNIFTSENELSARYGFLDSFWDLLLGQGRDGLRRCHLHLFIDLAGSAIQSGSEQEWEAHDIIDLVCVVGSAGGNDAVGPVLLSDSWDDFWVRVGHGEDDWVFVQAFHNSFCEEVG